MILIQASLSLFWLNLVLGSSLVPDETLKSENKDLKTPNNYSHHSLVKRTTKLQEEDDGLSDTKSYDIKLCESETMRYAKDSKTHEWYPVLNEPHEETHVVTVEVCKNANAPCDNLDHRNEETVYFKPRSGYGTRCEQKYFEKSPTGYNGSIIDPLDNSLLPMYCACVFPNN